MQTRNLTHELDGPRRDLVLCARTRGLYDQRPGAGGNARRARTVDSSHERGGELGNKFGASTP
jgi:hypothetical protein